MDAQTCSSQCALPEGLLAAIQALSIRAAALGGTPQPGPASTRCRAGSCRALKHGRIGAKVVKVKLRLDHRQEAFGKCTLIANVCVYVQVIEGRQMFQDMGIQRMSLRQRCMTRKLVIPRGLLKRLGALGHQHQQGVGYTKAKDLKAYMVGCSNNLETKAG
eukprot:1160808-Pelagomonas_calceolata.AAC.33